MIHETTDELEKFKKSGFGQSLVGEQVWPPLRYTIPTHFTLDEEIPLEIAQVTQ